MRVGFHAPDTVEELAYLVAEAADTRTPLEVMGRGTKREVGRPVQYGAVLSTESLTGITLYEPSELVLSARAGTPLAQIEQALAEHDQELAFEPIDLGPVLGFGRGQGTDRRRWSPPISPAAGASSSGSARDHVLGVQAVNGRGEMIKAGGRVMKNVTGYDLSRALGRLLGHARGDDRGHHQGASRPGGDRAPCSASACPTEPRVEALCLAMGTPFEVSGAVHLQPSSPSACSDQELADAGASVTAIRVENFPASARYRTSRLKEMPCRPTARRSSSTRAQPLPSGTSCASSRDVSEGGAPALAHLDRADRARPSSSPQSRPQDRRAACSTTGRAAWSGSRRRRPPTPAPSRSAAPSPKSAVMPL